MVQPKFSDFSQILLGKVFFFLTYMDKTNGTKIYLNGLA